MAHPHAGAPQPGIVRGKWIIPESWRSAAVCAAATALLGFLCLVISPVRFWFERLSYDLPCVFAPSASLGNVVVVVRDEKSYRDLNQEYGKLWDRTNYVHLLEKLAADQAKLAVFDVFLSDPGEPAKDAALAQAIQKNGRVVLAMDYRDYEKLEGGEPIYPREEFKNAAAGLGVSSCLPDEADGVVRRMHPGYGDHVSLAWAAAGLAGASAETIQTRLPTPRWLSYPSSLEQLRRISFSDALLQEPSVFSNKVVFVGGSPRTKVEGAQADEFATPFRRWKGASQPGVIIQAVSFLNLVRGDWLERPSPMLEMMLVLVFAAISAGALTNVRPWLGALVAVGMVVLLYVGACLLMFQAHRWLPWMIMAGAQVPFALIWSALAQTRVLAREKEIVASQLDLERKAVERLLPRTESEAATIRSDVMEVEAGFDSGQNPDNPTPTPAQPEMQVSPLLQGVKWLPPSVPDHKLVRCIGEGAYGQVWLARDVIGTHHAVKFVFRKTFNSDAPYEREFKGIHHFTPISRMHAGFVNILHVGRNENGGYFFYIMELADDEHTMQVINPDTYSARTLSRVIRKVGRLAPEDCVKLGMELSSALEFLHQRRLIHRDIKPSNVLFVHGQAKFADVGLVTQIDTKRPEATYIGTEGYIAPEGPGTAIADIYSLGKVLYEATMGMDRMRFPDLPTAAVTEASPLLMQLNTIILKACEFNPRERYQSAQQIHDDLKALLSHPTRK